MAPVLYMIAYSQPVRATLMTIDALNLEVELKEVNLMNKEQLAGGFTKLNPQHTVPTLVEDDGFVLWESHAIMPYLVDKYGKKNDPLYPEDFKKRSIINQRLHFNNSVLFPLNVIGPIIYEGEKTISEEKIVKVKEAYSFLEAFLERQNWVAGEFVTIADFSIISTVTSLDIVVPVTLKEFPSITAWLRRAEKLPYYQANQEGLNQMKMIIKKKLSVTTNNTRIKIVLPYHSNLIIMMTFQMNTIMAPTLYMISYSQPVRATLMTIKALNFEVNLKEVNLLEKQQLSREYTKLNPQHSVPTLVEEDGFVLWDSHAVMAYLVDKYGKNDSLYPKDIKKRAIINQRLHFENGVLFPATMAIIRPIIYAGEKIIPQDRIDKVKESYDFLEKFLAGRNWTSGDEVTIADFSIISSITTMDVVVPIDGKEYPNITAWIKRMEKLPYYDQNKIGLDQIRTLIENNLK